MQGHNLVLKALITQHFFKIFFSCEQLHPFVWRESQSQKKTAEEIEWEM